MASLNCSFFWYSIALSMDGVVWVVSNDSNNSILLIALVLTLRYTTTWHSGRAEDKIHVRSFSPLVLSVFVFKNVSKDANIFVIFFIVYVLSICFLSSPATS